MSRTRGVKPQVPPPTPALRFRGHQTQYVSVAGATRYLVYAGDRIALTLTDEPGALISAHSPPPRPGELQTHPFVTASAHIPEREGELRRLLDESSSTADFLDRLRSAGYRVEQVE